MAKFLNTSAINYFLEEIINNTKERLILISPFLKLNDRVKELLSDKNRLKIDIRIVYGKSELQPEEINWLNDLSYVRTSFCKNLHAKCYLNEESCIISSLNLYEFSQINNNEMGILLKKDEDSDAYSGAYEEAQRIIRISEEVKISLKRVTQEEKETSDSKNTNVKLSTSKFATELKLTTSELMEKLLDSGYVELVDNNYSLTHKGKTIGAESKKGRFGQYFVWPKNISID